MVLLVAIFSALLGFMPGLALALIGADPSGLPNLTIDLEGGTEARIAQLPPSRGPAGRPLVVIDAGHGGKDPGAISPHGGRREKDVTLALARVIRDELIASGRVRVALTRNEDRYVGLRERYEIARQLHASLFISIHADASPHNDGARGASIYTLSEVASDREAALLAARENSSGIIEGERLSEDAGINMILIDLAQRETMDMSASFARVLQREASSLFPFRPEYHRFASLIVLKAPDIPSILFESGYLTNAADAAYIHSPAGQRQIALGMRRAIEAYFARQIVAARQS